VVVLLRCVLGVEIASEVADGPYSVILEQVANGVAVRNTLKPSMQVGGQAIVGDAASAAPSRSRL
jgi:aspartate carbamoyltransferase catalytic subunit